MIVEKPTSLTTSFRFSNFPVARRMYAGLSSIDVRPSSVIVKTFCVIRGLILSCNFKISSASVPDVPSMVSDIAGLEVEVWGPKTTRSGTLGSVFGGDCINHPTGDLKETPR